MKIIISALLAVLSIISLHAQPTITKAMEGFPPSRESQVTCENYREYPFSQWSFRNIGGPLHVLMLPRSGGVHIFKESPDPSVEKMTTTDTDGKATTFEAIFKDSYANGVIVIGNNTILYENYWNGLSRDYQHTWFSISKSLASSALGILVEQKKVDLSVSPVHYVPELKGSAYERATIQDLLNMSTALGFKENYTDTASFFRKYYASSMASFHVKGSPEADPMLAEIYSTYDFLANKATANWDLQPGEVFEYNSSNADVISWIISRITGLSYSGFIRENVWAKIGAEHDAYMFADRAYMASATGGMNSTLRDAALFGTLILNRGSIDGKQIFPATWVDETLKLTANDKARYARNDIYIKAKLPWVAYKNFWWILDETKGEYAGVGIHGQVIYINRSAKLVVVYFSSQPEASSAAPASYRPFVSKLNACRALALKLGK